MQTGSNRLPKMKKPSNRIPGEMISPNFKPELKYGIRPENLNILDDREVRVALDCDRAAFADTVKKLREVCFTNVSLGAVVHRRIGRGIIPNIFWHQLDTLEINEAHPDLVYDFSQWRQTWAVQQSDSNGKNRFDLRFSVTKVSPIKFGLHAIPF